MSDLFFESANLAVIITAFMLLIQSGRKVHLEQRKGWNLIIAGFLFLLLGNVLDILDEFPQFQNLGKWEEMIGIMPGYVLLTIGFYRWFPEIVRLRKTEEKLRKVNEALAHRMEERRQAMHELAKARDIAEEANQSKDAFLATMSHEIRTPMNIVLGMQELLKDAKLSPKHREYLHLSTTAGKRLLFLINDLLDFAQIDKGKFTLDHRDFNLRTLMDEVTMILAPLASAKGVELTAHISSHLPTDFRGDQNRLGQIFTNLLTNAIKFTPVGGNVDLHGGPIANLDNKTEFLFEIRDTGVGIPSEKRDEIFDRFTQIDNSTSRVHEGTGLGLAISKHLVLMMNGEIGIDSNPNSKTGSTFFFSVILENQTTEANIIFRPIPLQGYSIYLFDCEGLQLTMLTDHLEKWGAAVYTEESQALIPDSYDIIIVNHKHGTTEEFLPMQNLTGDSRLLVLTDLMDQAWDQAAAYVGSITCLQKPVSSERLLKAILNPQVDEYNYNDPRTQARNIPVGSILIVDDQATNLLLTKALLEKIGFPEGSIDMVDSGEKALGLAATKEYQLILLDLRMPNMDGYQTAQAIRAGELGIKDTPVPIIAFTGDITKKSRRKCSQADMAGVLAKPTSLSDLNTIIQEYFLFTDLEKDNEEEAKPESSNSLIAALDAMGLPPENHREVAEALAEQLPSLLKSLEESIIAKEEEQARATAHVLKGSMANVLFPVLKDPSSQVHKLIRKKEWRQVKYEIKAYREIMDPIIGAIQTYLSSEDQESQ
jgi:signal transduction histidine kinase/CheY-like chemotaxis protein